MIEVITIQIFIQTINIKAIVLIKVNLAPDKAPPQEHPSILNKALPITMEN